MKENILVAPFANAVASNAFSYSFGMYAKLDQLPSFHVADHEHDHDHDDDHDHDHDHPSVLLRLHGTLMVVAWLFFNSLGNTVAR